MEYCSYNINDYFLHFYECTEDFIDKYKFIKRCSIFRFIHKLNYKKSKNELEILYDKLFEKNSELKKDESVVKVKKNVNKILEILDKFPKQYTIEKDNLSVKFDYENSKQHKLKIEITEDCIDYLILNENEIFINGSRLSMNDYKQLAEVIVNFLYYNQY